MTFEEFDLNGDNVETVKAYFAAQVTTISEDGANLIQALAVNGRWYLFSTQDFLSLIECLHNHLMVISGLLPNGSDE